MNWARQQIDYAESGDDTYLLASLHAYQLNGSDGSYAFLGCLIEVHGQGEPVCEWWGLWRTAEEFYDAVGDGGYNWVTPQMGEISDQVILSMWQKPKRRRKKVRVEVVVGHIVRQPDLDTLVNLVNANLRFGSGVAGAIHTAAGAELEQYCRRYSPIALGEAVVTPGFQLPNPYVIHARAASYINDDYPEKYLDLAITQALRVANDAGIKSMAMPAIGTGVFKFPPELVSCPADT